MKKIAVVLFLMGFMAFPVYARSSLAHKWYKQGVELGNKGKIKEALNKFQQAVTLDPNVFLYHLKMALAYKFLSRYPEAQAEYEWCVRKDRRSWDAWNGLGDVYRKLRFLRKALDAYKHALRLKRHSVASMTGLAATYAMLKDFDSALKEYKRALKRSKKNADVMFRIANIYLLEKKAPNKALKYYQDALKLAPGDRRVLFGMGMSYLKKNDRDNARKYLKQSCDKGLRAACRELFKL